MRRASQVVGKRRPRAGVVAAIAAAVLGAGGIAWATTRAVSQNVISACANDANALILSRTGSCPAGQTLVTWNQQGPQGAPGPAGASPAPVLAWGPSKYHGGFSIRAEIAKPGRYWIDGSVYLKQSGFTDFKKDPGDPAQCSLYTGPLNGPATKVGSWIQAFVYEKQTKSYFFPPFHSQIDVASNVLTLTSSNTPLEVYFSCRRGGQLDDVWTFPAIHVETASSPQFRNVVGPALPKQPHIGPGELKKVFGSG